MKIWEKCLCPKGPSQPKVLLVTVSRSALIFFLSGKPFPDSLCNAHKSGTSQREKRQGNKEIIWNHTGWMLLLLLLMWENDLLYCIIHSSSNNFTEMFSRRPDFTKIMTSSLDQQLFKSHSCVSPLPSSARFTRPFLHLLLQTSAAPSILLFLHSFIFLDIKPFISLSTQDLLNLSML